MADNEIEKRQMTAIKLHPDDNVATLIGKAGAEEKVSIVSAKGKIVRTVIAADSIPQYHKIAVFVINKEADVIKFGEVIGKATQFIREGEHVHIHNVASKRVR